MKIACLQLNASLGEVDGNIAKADRLLAGAAAETTGLDLLVLPELAFSGYNFPSLDAIKPYLEPTGTGVSTKWATRVAQQLNCVVVVGYPEDASAAPPELKPIIGPSPLFLPLQHEPRGVPVVPNTSPDFPYNFNSSVAISPSGSLLAHYRKSSIYYTDTAWAREGSGFWTGSMSFHGLQARKVAMGICMDINSHNFTNPWDAFEFGYHVVNSDAEIVIISMAWLSQELTPDVVEGPEALEPDTWTASYWVERLRPLQELMDSKLRILVMANRCGVERDVCYAGTSAVIGIKDGEVFIWDMCGKGEERLIVVDTEKPPKYILRPKDQHVDSDDEEDNDNELDD